MFQRILRTSSRIIQCTKYVRFVSARAPSSDTYYTSHRNQALRSAFNPYPPAFTPDVDILEINHRYSSLTQEQSSPIIKTVGRITQRRDSGSKLFFLDLESHGSVISVKASAKDYIGDYETAATYLRRGDVIGITGVITRNKKNILCIVPHEIQMLAPCLHQLPTPTHHIQREGDPSAHPTGAEGINNDSIAARQESHVNMLINPHARSLIQAKAKVWIAALLLYLLILMI